MHIIHPTNSTLVASRDSLLQQTMRPPALAFSVAQEYPIVLSEDSTELSYCVVDDGHVIAHANLWPRTMALTTTATELRVGLIGNVATHPDWQGRGVMQQLLQKLIDVAKEQNLAALILWSDLSKFYQKLEFKSVGQEFRFYFDRAKSAALPHADLVNRKFFPIEGAQISSAEIRALLELRCQTHVTVQRSIDEFRKLLSIPALTLLAGFSGGKMTSYMIVGKGYDMMGVVHEWGGIDIAEILAGLRIVLESGVHQEVILLTPTDLKPAWFEALRTASSRFEKHPMAFIRHLTSDAYTRTLIEQSFIWGLDSI